MFVLSSQRQAERLQGCDAIVRPCSVRRRAVDGTGTLLAIKGIKGASFMRIEIRALAIALAAAAAATATATVTVLALAQTRPGDATPSPATRVQAERLASLEYPWGMAWLPDGRLLITEKPGRLRIFENGKLSEPIQNVPEVAHRPTGNDQGGLLRSIRSSRRTNTSISPIPRKLSKKRRRTPATHDSGAI
jgi:hypothetical protein